MSFYFNLKTEIRVTEQTVLDAIDDQNVRVKNNPYGAVYFISGKSLRGVMVYETKRGYDIGLNAFSTREDIKLCRHIVAVIGSLTQAEIKAQDDDTLLSAKSVANYGGDAWVKARWHEAKAVSSMLKNDNSTACIDGYQVKFGISRKDFRNANEISKAEITAIQADGVELQILAEQDGIHHAELFEIKLHPLSVFRKLTRLLRAKGAGKSNSLEHFGVVENTRTLTPLLTKPEQASRVYLISAAGEKRWVPFDQFTAHLRALSHREFGTGVFDTTLSGTDFHKLFQNGSID
ncbi:hypothetical protein [Pacificibacter marinus]|uniref:hypothetical protein n=1 Tax=Pacificibacter marinus TaxID=658057 RepID=UPI001C064ED1|nr:hypothetical protein [Pacificibacter marinus]MBU2869017.1 hypothetical protein [Pacificibacter marinus]